MWNPHSVTLDEANETMYFPYKYAAGTATTDPNGGFIRVLYYVPSSLTPNIFELGHGAGFTSIILHELGHFANFDSFMALTDSMELEADKFSGYYLAKYSNFTLDDALSAVNTLTSINAVNGYPSREQRKQQVIIGFNKGREPIQNSVFYSVAHSNRASIDLAYLSTKSGSNQNYTAIYKMESSVNGIILTSLKRDFSNSISSVDIINNAYKIEQIPNLKEHAALENVKRLFIRPLGKDSSKKNIEILKANKVFSSSAETFDFTKALQNVQVDSVFKFTITFNPDTVKAKSFSNSNNLVYLLSLKSGINGFYIADRKLYFLDQNKRLTIGNVFTSDLKNFSFVIVDDFYKRWYINTKNEIYYFENNNQIFIGNLYIASNFLFK